MPVPPVKVGMLNIVSTVSALIPTSTKKEGERDHQDYDTAVAEADADAVAVRLQMAAAGFAEAGTALPHHLALQYLSARDSAPQRRAHLRIFAAI